MTCHALCQDSCRSHAEAEGPEICAVLVEQAIGAIRQGDGVAAEMKLRAALDAGVEPAGVKALMGEVVLLQDDRIDARKSFEERD